MSSRASLKLKVDFDAIVGFLYFSISNLSRMLLQLLGIPREITYGLYMILLALYILKYIPRLKMIDVIYYIITIIIVAVGLAKYSKYIDPNSRIYAVLLLFLPSYLFFKFYDREQMVKVFVASQYYAIIYLLIYYIVVVRFQYYSMDYGYWISIPICTMAFLYITKRKILDLIMVLIAIVTIILSGNRGSLILSFICILYYYVFPDEKQNKGKKWIVRNLILGLSIILVISTAKLWIGYLGKFSEKSRTIQTFIQGELLTSTTRELLYARVSALIANRKNGYGPLASRMLLRDQPYPHSLIYEMQMDFGFAIGTVLSVSIILMSILNLIKYRKSDLRLIVGFIELVGIGSLMVSSSYYYEIYVPATIALFVSYKRKIDGNRLQLSDNAEHETKE